MQFMTKMMNRYVIMASILLIHMGARSQSEGLTSSPYSLYGLGTINQTSIGQSNGLGYSGIAHRMDTGINNLNPANYALVPQNSFFYDIGVVGEYNNYSNRGDDESKTTFNFSNIAFAFRIANRLGAGISLIPYSDVGYTLLGLVSNIEGSDETFESNVSGIGGLNDFGINLGYGITDQLRLGVRASVLFGNIEEKENFVISNSYFELNETTNYSALRLGMGMQYDITDKISVGGTVQLPVTLTGNLTRSVSKTLDGEEIIVEDEEEDDVSDFKLPMELGFGISAKILKSFTLNADYKKNFWDATDQSESIGTYADQDIYAIGLEYVNKSRGYKYWERIRYRAGFNYDNGYLAINNNKIDGYNITMGIGLPTGYTSNSLINLSYAYGSKGQINNILVKENYHSITLNLSLEDLWFAKRKID
ncbi:Long-chain fatty acid transport protein [Flagellimonas taeanensis]|uniref:Long-chain fatty acid transport protein n=2 Tax=Flagellimonas taeanensis TaxID=1005926 RepID=A0A1M6YPS9_9FLAO|nr:Long-chain fatty acid transport protein [Allomuricauda taeanensis]SHL20334.1 Long-chain fatty acid transport protein [Allomuricauda taeanensis]